MLRALSKPLIGSAAPSLPLLIAVTMTGTIAMHIFVPAMPAAARDLGVSPSLVQSTITLYIAGLAFGQLFYGPLSDRFGRRPALLASLAIYLAGLLAAIPAASIGGLVAARILQSLGACGALVIGRAMVRDSATGDDIVRRLAVLTIAMTVTPALAPAIGGYVVSWFGWRAIFVMLAAVVAALLALVGLALPETSPAPLALPGMRSMLVNYGRLLMLPAFRNYLIAGSLCTTSIYAFLSASPFLFIDVLHRSAREAGTYCMVILAGLILGASLARRYAGRMPVRSGALWGSRCCLVGAGLLLLIDRAHLLSVPTIVLPMLVYSVGIGLMSPNAVTGLMNAAPRTVGMASSLYGFFQMSFGALVTLIVALWHDGSALPVAATMVSAAVVAQLALHRL
ncbi:MAG: multidrug effflux MFS transporter [Alphaproteobacteria bacterium]|nr:multidrug effflux MFS transporter [Alphaproteobacteria bacterium]